MRKGKISLENVSGGELTSAPLLSTPTKYSRLLQNFYINAEGHITKIPGYSPISNQVSNVKLTTGIDFKKSDGTSIKMVGGLSGAFGALYRMNSGVMTSIKSDFSSPNPIYLSQIGDLVVASNGVDLPISYDGVSIGNISMPFSVAALAFVGTGLNDMEANVSASTGTSYDVVVDGVATSIITPSYGGATGLNDMTVPNPSYVGGAPTTFDVAVDVVGAGDTLKYNVNGGAFATAQQLSTGGAQDYLSYRSGISSPIGAWQTPQALSTTAGVPIATTNANLNIKASTIGGHNPNDVYELQLVWTKDASGYTFPLMWTARLYYRKNGGAWNLIVQTSNGVPMYPLNNYFTIDANYSVEMTSYTTSSSGFYVLFQVNNQATDLTVGYLKSDSTIGHLNTDVYEVQVLGNYGDPGYAAGLGYQWRKNGGAWTVKSIPYANATLYDTIADGYSILFKSPVGNVVSDIYSFQVDGATTPDTFKWRKGAEAYTTGVPIVVGQMVLKEGISVQFSHFTGHVVAGTADSWSLSAAQDTVKYRVGSGAYTENVPITGAFQDIIFGVQFKFTSVNGHTLADKWTIPVDQSVRFGKSYTYKNRLWLIAQDKLTVYYSQLRTPTDFVSDGAGYIDFRYVLPSADELVDICSLMNYLVFFFKNHIVIYAGTDPTAEGDFIIYQNIPNMGLLAPGTVVSVGSDIYFLTNKGVKSLTQTLTAGSLNVGNVSKDIDLDIIAAIDANTSGVYASAHYATLGFIMFLIGTTMLVYNYRQKAWSRVVIPSVDDVSKILSMFETADGYVLMGGYDYLFEFDPTPDTYNFNGVAPVYKWTSSMLKVTTADAMYFNELMLRLASSKAATLTLRARTAGFDTSVEDQSDFNEQTIDVPAITNNYAVLNFLRVPLFGAGRFIQIELTESPTYDSNDDVEIVGVDVAGELGIL